MKIILYQSDYNGEQRAILTKCRNMKFDASRLTPYIDCFKMRLAYLAYKNGDDITRYLKDFNHDQLHEIRLGMMMKVDVSQYADTKLLAEDMYLKRISLEDKEILNKA
ncbi:MAG: hypothetical protein EKK54_04370 [Neisseriaceae bacterium]|nr:MAG: hypothetical protein EKK54_04370 [Neisseriaceae bacterium]